MSIYKQIFKPSLDFFISLLLLFALSPIIIGVVVVLAISNKGSVFFFQIRPGYKAIPFKILKFKTMRDSFDDLGRPLPDSVRITRVGHWIRSASLDELLQLINVIKGDMSIVGPRPLLIQYLSRYTPEQALRHNVKPGITGWAQVNGRNSIDWQTKFKLDVEYVRRQSFALDLKILWMTILNVLQRKGINSEDHVTMNEFMG